MNYFDHSIYIGDICLVTNQDLPWERLKDKTILVSGGSGLIGSFFVDVLMKKNENGLGCRVIALGRNKERAYNRFERYWDSPLFSFICADINAGVLEISENIDYVIHLASNTHPVAYSTDPINTIMTNIIGTRNMLELARTCNSQRFVFASSNEVYGENRGDCELFDEKYCGYIDCNTLRAGYPESKRCGEALCQAYIKQYGMDVVIPRFTRSYGPTLLASDTKALTQFLHNGINKQNIVLKSEGRQYYSYTYVADAVSGLLTVMLKGICGEAYNIADVNSDIRLRDLAGIVAYECGTEVIFDLPDAVEKEGFSKATKARLDSSKLKALGWEAKYDIKKGLSHTLTILQENEKD